MMHDAWCMMHDAWRMMHDAWCMMRDTWCIMYGAWCMMHDAWCTMYHAIPMTHDRTHIVEVNQANCAWSCRQNWSDKNDRMTEWHTEWSNKLWRQMSQRAAALFFYVIEMRWISRSFIFFDIMRTSAEPFRQWS